MELIQNVSIVINAFSPDAFDLAGEIEQFLLSRACRSKRFVFDGSSFADPCVDCDAVISLGGDGTVLFAARYSAPKHIPLFAVNLGQFGFLAAVQKNDWKERLSDFLQQTGDVHQRILLNVSVLRKQEVVFSCPAMNDAVVSGIGIAKIVHLEASVNGLPLGGYRADGIIAATPTGSTAYSAAAGGPIIDPDLDAFVLNPVCAFTLSSRPLVVSASEKLCITVLPEQRTGIALTVDGQESFLLVPGDCIFIEKAPFHVLLAGCSRSEFYAALRSKLSWSGGYATKKDVHCD